MDEIRSDLLNYLANVVLALKGVSGETSYGEYHLGPIPVQFDGEPTGFVIEEDEFGWVVRNAREGKQ